MNSKKPLAERKAPSHATVERIRRWVVIYILYIVSHTRYCRTYKKVGSYIHTVHCQITKIEDKSVLYENV